MEFNWIDFLSGRGIPFVTKGPNLSRNDLVAIQCPWCKGADPSHHLAIGKPGFCCLRNPDHKGRNPARLVQILIGCSWQEALSITGAQVTRAPENLLDCVEELLNPPKPSAKAPLQLPKEFRPFRQLPSARPYINYLRRRGFTSPERLTKDYGICYCVEGPFKGRIIFPVYFEGNLVSWTGRTISSRSQIRYKSLTNEISIGPISNYLLWFDTLKTTYCQTIVICEGPFDALRVNVFGEQDGICSTCFFTSAPSRQQANLLHELLPQFRRRILLLDQGTLPAAMRISAQLRSLNIQVCSLPPNVKDPGELSARIQLLKALAF